MVEQNLESAEKLKGCKMKYNLLKHLLPEKNNV